MNVNLSLFFPPGTSVIAAPNRQKPRLFLPNETLTKRWQKSGLYPATRWQAKVYRSMIRFKTALGIGKIVVNEKNIWPLMEFVYDILPDIENVVVLIGTPGLYQKIIVQLWNSTEVIGYLKYGETTTAQERITKEFQVLSGIPPGLGPSPLKYGRLGKGKALVISPVFGKQLAAQFPPPDGLNKILKQMTQPLSYSIEKHPWILKMMDNDLVEMAHWLEALAGEKWSLVFQHGDVAPWNVLQSAQDCYLIDWEYGELEGFPYIDLIHYILQVLGLIHRLKPAEAFRYTLNLLSKGPYFIKSRQAESLVRLAALSSYLTEPHNKECREHEHQVWRSKIWSLSKAEF